MSILWLHTLGHSLLQSVGNATTQRDYLAAVRYLQRILELNARMERIHRRLMALFLQQGDRAAAIAQYETLTTILACALGVEPAAETQSLYERARTQPIELRANLPCVDSLAALAFVRRDGLGLERAAWANGVCTQMVCVINEVQLSNFH